MLIRSQNKMSLVKFKNIVININNISGKEIICWSQMNPGEDEYISLGHYSTKAKALKVLDMIEEAYTKTGFAKAIVSEMAKVLGGASAGIDDELTKSAGEALVKLMCFQMPADNEVEV